MIFSFLFPLHPLTTSPDTEEGRTLTFVLILLLVFGTGTLMCWYLAWVVLFLGISGYQFIVSTLVPIYDMKLEAFPCRGHTNIYIK